MGLGLANVRDQFEHKAKAKANKGSALAEKGSETRKNATTKKRKNGRRIVSYNSIGINGSAKMAHVRLRHDCWLLTSAFVHQHIEPQSLFIEMSHALCVVNMYALKRSDVKIRTAEMKRKKERRKDKRGDDGSIHSFELKLDEFIPSYFVF